MIEVEVKAKLGEEKFQRVKTGLTKHLEDANQMDEELVGAIELLNSLEDFLVFKKVMLLKKAELKGGTGGHQMIDKGVLTVDTIPEYMERLQSLREDAATAEGWVQIIDTPEAGGWTMQTETGYTLLRLTVHVDLPARTAFHMMWNTT